MDVTCELYVDGTRFADTAPIGADPVALDGLAITWGRESVAEQPDTSSCDFTVHDGGGGTHFRDLLNVGAVVEVFASGQVPQAEVTFGADYVVDGSFETLPAGDPGARVAISAGSRVTVTTGGGSAGANYLRLTRVTDTTTTVGVVLPPDAFSSAVGAWDRLPEAEPGTTQRWSVDIRTPLRAGVVTIQPHIRQPSSATGPYVGAPVVVTTTGTGWQTVTRDLPIPPGTPPGWLALWVRAAANPTTWAAAPGTWAAAPGIWAQYAPNVDVDQLRLYPPGVTIRRVLVWSGRISDLTASPLPDVSGSEVKVLAVDSFADLANRYVGDTPWPAEAMSARFARVLAAANPVATTSVIDPAPGAMRVCSRDVDNASAGGLLTELATSTDAVLWFACHTGRGGYLWVEDPAFRTNLEHLANVGGIWVIASGPSANAPAPISLSACDVLADPVQWEQSAEEIATRVDVTWQEAGTPDNTERTYSVVDAPAELAYGVHRYGLSTQLALLADATTVANRVLTRAHTVDWRMSGLVWDTRLPVDTDTAVVNAAMDLLDGTHRLGIPIAVSDLPEWSPVGEQVGVYCEGGTWEFTGGRWVLSMNVTPAQPGAAIVWAAAPAGPPPMTWTTTDPAMTWADLATVGA